MRSYATPAIFRRFRVAFSWESAEDSSGQLLPFEPAKPTAESVTCRSSRSSELTISTQCRLSTHASCSRKAADGILQAGIGRRRPTVPAHSRSAGARSSPSSRARVAGALPTTDETSWALRCTCASTTSRMSAQASCTDHLRERQRTHAESICPRGDEASLITGAAMEVTLGAASEDFGRYCKTSHHRGTSPCNFTLA